MGRRVVISLLSLLLSSCYDSFGSLTPTDNSGVADSVNATIEQLHAIYEAGSRQISSEIIIEGVVTANDEHDNFFKSFIVEDDGYALEVLDGLYSSYIYHPVGSRIVVRLNGLGIDRYMGILRCGIMASDATSYTLDYMSSLSIIDLYITVVETGSAESVSPRLTSITEIDESAAGEFVRFDSLQLLTEDGIEREWEEYALFRDKNLDTIWCYTSSYATFTNNKIPQEIVSLQGILQFGSTDELSDQFILKMRCEEDCIY